MDNPSLAQVFGPDWQQKLAASPISQLQAGGMVLVPNMGWDDVNKEMTSTPASYTVFNASDGGKQNWLFDTGGNFQNTYAGNNPFTWKDLARGVAMVGLGMVSGGALSGLAAGTGALSGASSALGFGGGGASAGGAGGFLGEGVASGVPAWDAAAGSGVAGAGGAGTIAASSYEAPSAVSGWSSTVAPGELGSGSYGLTVPGVSDVATGGALGSGTYGVEGATAGAAGAGLSGSTPWLAATGTGLGTLGGPTAAALGAEAGGGILSGLGNLGQWVGPAASLVGGIMGSNAAGKASDAQLQAAREAMALNEPFRQGGIAGMNRLTDLLGISGRTGAEGYGSAAKDFSMADFQADPGYAFRQSEGQKALERSAAARGGLYSGRAMKDITRFGQDTASQEYGNAFNRYQVNRSAKLNPLQSLMGAGQTASNTIADYRTQAGNAQAAGAVGSANAVSNGLSGAVGAYQQNQLLNMLQNRSQSAYT